MGFCACGQTDTNMNNNERNPITGFELERYLGTWYEIARYPHSFEKKLQGVTATYSMKENGMVKVENAGYKNTLDGKYKKATGKAKFAGDPTVGHLKVSFFLFFYGDYIIMEMDKENYQWAVIGSTSPNYLWILSREPEMDPALYKKLTERLANRGYDLTPLQKISHKP